MKVLKIKVRGKDNIMAKTKEELEQLKQEYEALKTKLDGLTEEEIEQIVGGFDIPGGSGTGTQYEQSFYDNNVKKPEDFKSNF